MPHTPLDPRKLIVGLLLLAGIGGMALVALRVWQGSGSLADETFEQALLLKDVEQLGAYSIALQLLDEGREDQAREVLEFGLIQSAMEARDLVRDGHHIDIPINLVESVRRAKIYAESRQLEPVTTHTNEVLRALADNE